MPPAVTDIVLIRKQVLEALIAMPTAVAQRYSDAVGSNSTYAVLQELTDKALIIDEAICLDIMSTYGHPYINKFMTLSAALSSGDRIPEHVGILGDVQVAIESGGTYGPSVPAKNREEILRMIANETLYGGPSRHHFIESGFLYHSGYQVAASGKVYYPVFTKSATLCQSPDYYSDAVYYGTLDLAEKLNSDDPFFARNRAAYLLCRQMIKGGAEFLPAAEQLDAMRKVA